MMQLKEGSWCLDVKKLKVVIVNPPKEFCNKDNANYWVFPHTWLVMIASQLKGDHNSKIDVTTIDWSSMLPEELIEEVKKLDPEVLWISVLTQTLKNTIALILSLKSEKPSIKIIIWNDGAEFHGKKWLEHNKFPIDGIITNDMGHISFSQYIWHLLWLRDKSEVDSLLYIDTSGSLTQNSKREFPVRGNTPELDFSYFDSSIDQYTTRYNEAFPSDKFLVPMVINNARWCYREKNPCVYCSISNLKIKIGYPEDYWSAVKATYNYATSKFWTSMNEKKVWVAIFEVFDSLFSNKVYVRELIDTIPTDIKALIEEWLIQQTFYINTDHASKDDNIPLIKALWIKIANMWLDSGSKTVTSLKSSHDSIDKNSKALKNMRSIGVKVHASFILWAEWETQDTANETMRYIAWIIDLYHQGTPLFSAIEVSMFIPLPWSKSWEYLEKKYKDNNWKHARNKKVFEEYLMNEDFPLEPIKRLWLEEFTEVSYEYIWELIQKIDEIIVHNQIMTWKNAG